MTFDPTTVAGSGMDNLPESTKMPLINIAQALSDQIKKKNEKYIEGLEVGDIFHSGLEEKIETPSRFIPVARTTLYVEWKPKSMGGGIVGMHPLTITQDPRYVKGRDAAKPYAEHLGEHDLVETHYWCVLLEHNGEWIEAMFAFTSTQLKVSRALGNAIRKFRYKGKQADVVPFLFSQSWTLDVAEESNAKGDFYSFKIDEPKVLDFKSDSDLLSYAAESAEAGKLALPTADAQNAPQLTQDANGDAVIDAEVF